MMMMVAGLPGMSIREIQALCDNALPDEKAACRYYMDVAMMNNIDSTDDGVDNT